MGKGAPDDEADDQNPHSGRRKPTFASGPLPPHTYHGMPSTI